MTGQLGANIRIWENTSLNTHHWGDKELLQTKNINFLATSGKN